MDLVNKKNYDFNIKVFSNGGVFILPNFRQSLYDVWLSKLENSLGFTKNGFWQLNVRFFLDNVRFSSEKRGNGTLRGYFEVPSKVQNQDGSSILVWLAAWQPGRRVYQKVALRIRNSLRKQSPQR